MVARNISRVRKNRATPYGIFFARILRRLKYRRSSKKFVEEVIAPLAVAEKKNLFDAAFLHAKRSKDIELQKALKKCRCANMINRKFVAAMRKKENDELIRFFKKANCKFISDFIKERIVLRAKERNVSLAEQLWEYLKINKVQDESRIVFDSLMEMRTYIENPYLKKALEK